MNESAFPSETLDLKQAAELVRVGLEAMREVVESGEVPALSLNRKHTVLLREDVLDFIRTRARKQAEERRQAKAGTTRPGRRRRGPAPSLERYGG